MSKVEFIIEENTSEFKVIRVDELPKDFKTLEIKLNKNSKATIILIHESKDQLEKTIKTNFTLKENSNLNVIDIIITEGIFSLDQEIYLKGNNSSAKSTVIFFGSKDEEITIKTKVWHHADNTKGDLICRGVLQENSKADFIAKISVPKNIKNIESHQNMKCLTQGDNTKCKALPILDVQSDAVVCSHGVAIGRVEEENIFYLQSRGIAEATAKSMVLHGLLMQELISIKQAEPEIYQEVDKSINQKLGINLK